MASMAVARTFTAAAAVCPSASAVSRSSSSGAASLLPPLGLSKRSFNGVRASTSKRSENAARFVVRATTSSEDAATDASKQVDDLVAEAKAKWEAVENKSTVAIYAGGALVTLWLSSTIIGAVNSVPLLPKLLELVGLGYTGWFVYRYLLFKSSRKELVSDIEELKGKITGATGNITGSEEKLP